MKKQNASTTIGFASLVQKPTLNAVFLDKDIDERCKIFLDSMEARIANLESK